MSTKDKVNDLFKNYWQWRLKESPEFATFIGNHDFGDKLESYSLESFQNTKLKCEDFIEKANALLSESIDEDSHLNLELLISDLQIFITGADVKGYLFPVNFLEGVHIEFERLVSFMPLKTVTDYQKLISRYRAFPLQATEIIDVLREGIKMNMTCHAVSMDGVLRQLDELQQPVEESVFYKPFLSIPDFVTTEEREKLQSDGRNAVIVDLLPSFKRLQSFIAAEYLKAVRPNIAASSLPKGHEFYQKCLDFHLGFHITPEEVHETGLQEVERIGIEMDKVISDLELNISRKEFAQKMRDDHDFYFTSQEELLEAYRGMVINRIRPKLSEIIKTIPKSKVSIEPSPSSMANGPAAYYYAGTPDGSRPGVFHVNTASVNSSPKYEMMTLALHECEPGHHLQISYLMELEGIPEFRRHIEDRKYSYAPSRFPLHTAYLEGWGLYSEYLGYELELYDDPYLNYGHLSHEMFRACRLVVDTGMHALGWTREQAVNFMLEHTATHKDNIENEIKRYITWPGQACAYKIGEIKLKELRKMAEAELGPKFDVREFHDVVLRSSGALSLVQKKVREYIQQQSK